jgi:hypothetical protein
VFSYIFRYTQLRAKEDAYSQTLAEEVKQRETRRVEREVKEAEAARYGAPFSLSNLYYFLFSGGLEHVCLCDCGVSTHKLWLVLQL